jgi:hypothetical protein
MTWALRVLGILAVGVLAAAFLMPYSTVSISGESTSTQRISVPARALEVVCPGSLYQVGGETGTEVDSVEPISDADFFLVRQGEVTPFRGTLPAVFTADGNAQDSVELSGYQWQELNEFRISGFAASTCKKPVTEAWMLGGKTNLGSESLLILHNPDVLSTILDIRIFSASEESVDSTSLAPGETKVINLSRYVSTEEAIGINIQSQGGRFVAWMQSKTNSGVTPTGIDLEAHNQLQKNPTMLISAQSDDLPQELRLPELSALVTETISTTISISSLDGGFGDAFRVDLNAGVNTIQLPDLETGSYRVTLEAEAALLSARTTNPLAPDFFITQSEKPVSGDIHIASVLEGAVEIASVDPTVATLRVIRGGETIIAFIGEVSGQALLAAEVIRGDRIEISGENLLIRVKSDQSEYLAVDNSNLGSELEITVR